MKKWLVMLVAVCAATFAAQADTPHTVLDYNEADEWHFNDYTGDDFEGNVWEVEQTYYR